MLDNVGTVNSLLEDGDLLVRYPNNTLLPVNTQAANKVCTYMYMSCDVYTQTYMYMYMHVNEMYICDHMQVDMPMLESGDVVRMISDMAEVYRLQQGHGEWNDDMALVSAAKCVCS